MKKWLLCAVFFLVAAAFACLGMFHLERAAFCLPEGIIYADPNGVVQQPMEEDALDFPWIASYVKEGEWDAALDVSSQVTTAEEAEQLVDFTSWAWHWRTSSFHQRYCHYAPPAENCLLAGVDSLFTGHCLLRYGEDLSPPVEDLHRNQESCRSLIPVRCVSGIVRGVCYRMAVTANTRYLPANRAFL